MTPTSSRKSWPRWVRIVLWKTERRAARRCVWLSLLGAVVSGAVSICFVIAVWAWKVAAAAALLAALCMLAAILYDRAVKWVDRHGTWS